ncbi:MAG TPA: Trm112 family protein, partial [Armatimonadota bacterium]|nr:Trm112 family protein [Armatimonadota bacterium]
MKQSVLPFLTCPAPGCAGPLVAGVYPDLPARRAPADPDELLEGALHCANCRVLYPVLSGV